MKEDIYKLQRTLMLEDGNEAIYMTNKEGTVEETIHMSEEAVFAIFMSKTIIYIRGKLADEPGPLLIYDVLAEQDW